MRIKETGTDNRKAGNTTGIYTNTDETKGENKVRKYTGLKGRTYTTEDSCIGGGGEGAIYRIEGEDNLVAKIFRKGCNTEERKDKLIAIMSAVENAEETRWVAWPVDILSDNGKFAGYVMPLFEGGEPLDVIYSAGGDLTHKEKERVAENLCRAVGSVHSMGHVIGDLCSDNILVNPKTQDVRLIGTDSYHISNGNRTYRCVAGMDMLFPQELRKKLMEGATLATADLPTFTQQTDVYALAVHVYALLTGGAHPYGCEKGVITPEYAPEHAVQPGEIGKLFLRALGEGASDPSARPSAAEWQDALQRMEEGTSGGDGCM